MAKVQAITAISPALYETGRPILGDGDSGATRLAQLNNWLFGKRRQSLLAMTMAGDGWGTLGVGTLRAIIEGSTQRQFVDTDRLISNEARVVNLTCYVELTTAVPVGTTVRISFRFTGSTGSTQTVFFDFTSATPGERNVTILPSTFMNEGDDVRIEILGQRTAGTGTYEILEVSIEENEVTTGLPDPDNS